MKTIKVTEREYRIIVEGLNALYHAKMDRAMELREFGEDLLGESDCEAEATRLEGLAEEIIFPLYKRLGEQQ